MTRGSGFFLDVREQYKPPPSVDFACIRDRISGPPMGGVFEMPIVSALHSNARRLTWSEEKQGSVLFSCPCLVFLLRVVRVLGDDFSLCCLEQEPLASPSSVVATLQRTPFVTACSTWERTRWRARFKCRNWAGFLRRISFGLLHNRHFCDFGLKEEN